MQTPHINK